MLKISKKDIGMSISCDGVCLTLINISNKLMEFYLSNETITASLRKTHLSATAYSFTTAKVSATDGTCSVTMTDAVTTTLTEGRYVWDLTTTDSSGLINRRIEGRATLTPSVTRS